MTNPNTTEDLEAPLDPALEKVRRKMIRLLIVSSSVIILGLMAVVFSVVYRVDKLDDKAKAEAAVQSDIVPPAQQTLTLPAGFNVVSTAMDGNRILVIGVTPDGARRMYVHDIGTGQRLTEIEIK